MRKFSRVLAVLPFLVAACAGNPEPGDEGYPYNLNGTYDAEFVTDEDGQAFAGSLTLGTAQGGVVTGMMELRDPATVEGDVEGLIFEDELTITIPYTIIDNGCSGVASGLGVIAEGGDSVTGHVDIADECGGPSGATFTLTRAAGE